MKNSWLFLEEIIYKEETRMAKKAEVKTLEILSVDLVEVPITIIGKTPLIVHRWSEKAKREMLEKQMGVAKKRKHEIKVPTNDFIGSLNWLTPMPELGEDDAEAMQNFEEAIKKGARFGFHIGGIKQSFITGAYRSGMDVKQTELRGSFFLRGAGEYSTTDYAEIVTPEAPHMREDTVMVGGMSKSADLRYRGQFDVWEIPLIMQYNRNGKYSLEQLLNIVNAGGFAVGIGEWRPEKDGQYGMYYLKQQ
jgi:hypothetical protein